MAARRPAQRFLFETERRLALGNLNWSIGWIAGVSDRIHANPDGRSTLAAPERKVRLEVFAIGHLAIDVQRPTRSGTLGQYPIGHGPAQHAHYGGRHEMADNCA